MDMVNMENIDELVKAQTQIWNHSLSFIKSMCLKCAVELGIPDIINNNVQPISLSDLVASLPVHPNKTNHVFRLMRILVHSGFFSLEKSAHENIQERYGLTPASLLLLESTSLDYRPFVSLVLEPVLVQPFEHLSTWFKNDDLNPFFTTTGETLWGYSSHDPRLNFLVNEAMACDSSLIGRIITTKCKEVFEGIDSLVDVGGGVGIVAKAISNSFPDINCTVLDLPHVVADLKGTKNLNFVSGDMFEALPPADAFLFKWILHGWGDEDCLKMLKKCKESLMKKREGKIIIIDMVLADQTLLDEDDWSEVQLLFDMAAMTCGLGKQRTEKEWAKLFIDAGFTNYKINHVLGPRALIQVFP